MLRAPARPWLTTALLLLTPPALAAPWEHKLRAASLPLTVAPTTTVSLVPSRSGPAYLHHAVQPGDSLSALAARYGLRPRAIKLASGITSDELALGQVLRVPLAVSVTREPRLPPGVRRHEVQPGEVLSSIRADYGLTQAELVSANPGLPSLDRLAAGTILLIPGESRGLVVRLKPGQSLADIADYFSVPLATVAQANNLADPRELETGDYVLVPGLRATGTLALLEKRRAEEIARIEAARRVAEARRLAALEKARREAEARARLEAERRARLEAEAQRRAEEQARLEAEARRLETIAATRRAAVARRAAERARLEAEAQARKAAERANIARATRVAASYRPPAARSAGYAWPMRSFQLTSSYGPRGFRIGGSNFHTGLDLAAPAGTPIYAAASGTVIEAGYGDYGLNVVVGASEGVTNIYGHMSRSAVSPGESVARGDLLGWVGCTGICTGPHLHFEVRVNGSPRDPSGFLP